MNTVSAAPPVEPAEQETSKRPKGALSLIGFWIRALLVVAWFLLCSAVGIVLSLVKPGDPTNSRRFSRLNSWLGLRILGLDATQINPQTMLDSRPCVFVTNHQANEDIFIHGWVFPTRSVVTGKRELIKIPLFGWMFKNLGNIMLDRSNHRSAVQELQAAADRVRAEQISVWIYPEGHRNRKRELLPFKRGAFHLAVLAQVPIVPIATQQYLGILDFKTRTMHGGTVRVEVLEPIATVGMTEEDVPALAARAQSAIAEALERLGPAR